MNTRADVINYKTYESWPLQANLTCKNVISFLAQFPEDMVLAWYLIGEDQTPFVGLYAEDPGEPGYNAYPMVVTSFVKDPA